MEVTFLKIKAKNTDLVVTMTRIFNDVIWKKNDISLRFFSGQSTSGCNPIDMQISILLCEVTERYIPLECFYG